MITPVDGLNGTVPTGTTYTWLAPVVTGGMTGGEASSSPSASISGILANTTGSLQTATYTVTPVSESCTGSTFTVTVTVTPATTYYSYQTGSWDNPTSWTSDPSGTLQIGTTIPEIMTMSPYLLAGQLLCQVMLATKTLKYISMQVDSSIRMFICLLTTLLLLSGRGTFKLASVNYPVVFFNTFINAGGGTTEYDNTTDFIRPLGSRCTTI
ncbi:MAG: PKD-like domain-containing protein [Bacteroidales bacterium]